jgi:hypothetical protein
VRTALIDLLALLGFALFLFGVWLVYRPAAAILGGALLVTAALLLSRGVTRDSE